MMIKALHPQNSFPFVLAIASPKTNEGLIQLLGETFLQSEISPYRHILPRVPPPNLQDIWRLYQFFPGSFPLHHLETLWPDSQFTYAVFFSHPVNRFENLALSSDDENKELIGLPVLIRCLGAGGLLHHPAYAANFQGKYTRMLSKDGDWATRLKQAFTRLEQMDFVGLTEQIEDSLTLLAWRFGWPPIRYSRRKNVSPGRERRSQVLSEALRKEVQAKEWADKRLYAAGKERFARDWAQFEAYRQEAGEGWWRQRLVEEVAIERIGRSGVLYDLRRVYPGQGWYPGEAHPRFGVIRWSGPETQSYVYFYIQPQRDVRLLVRIVGWLKQQVKESWTVRVNGKEGRIIRRWREEGSEVIEVAIPGEQLAKDGVQEVAFEVVETVAPAEIGVGADERKLGLAYQWIAVFAA